MQGQVLTKTSRKRHYYKGKKPISLSVTPGVKIWSNGIPVKADTYRSCSLTCGYCFARSLTGGMYQHAGVMYDPRLARHMNLPYEARQFQKAIEGEPGWMYWAIRNRYYIELGTMAEVFQPEDEDMRITWSFLEVTGAYGMPLFINTKAALLITNDKYYRKVSEYPAPVIISMTLIGLDDQAVKKLEPNAPLVSERLKLIKQLKEDGIPTVVYLAPFIKGVSDVNYNEFTEALIDAGAVGCHVRNFYIQGSLYSAPRWKRYYTENADIVERHGQGMKHISSYMQEQYEKMQEHASKIDPRFQVVGLKSSWFDLNANHGKLAMDWLPPPFKDGIIDFTAIPILRKVRENLDKPQLLLYSNMGYKQDKVRHPLYVPTGEGWNSESAWLNLGCMGCIGGTDAPRGKRWMDGWEWVKGGLWNGLKFTDSFLTSVRRIHKVYDYVKDEEAVDENGDKILAYIPPDMRKYYVDEDNRVPLQEVGDFHVPSRPSGTEDKWEYKPELTYDLGERWKKYARKSKESTTGFTYQ